jgi:CrcB protein
LQLLRPWLVSFDTRMARVGSDRAHRVVGEEAPAGSCRILDRMPVVIGIAVAGALGALARYGLDELIGRRTGAFPWGIFVVNITGAFLIGFAVEYLEPRFEDSWVRAAVVTGFLGAYTTFSTFSLDTYRLLEEGHTGQAGFNAFGTLAAGLVAVWLGLKVGRTV